MNEKPYIVCRDESKKLKEYEKVFNIPENFRSKKSLLKSFKSKKEAEEFIEELKMFDSSSNIQYSIMKFVESLNK